MLFNTRHFPAAPISQYVENLWLVRGVLPFHWRNMIFPDGAVELIINLGDPQVLCDPVDHRRQTVFKRSWISGERTQPIVIDESGVIRLVGVRFKPGGAHPFCRLPMSELTGQVVELEEVFGTEIEGLRERLARAPDDRTIFARLEQWLLLQLCEIEKPHLSVARALTEIRSDRDPARIGRIAESIGISHRHLTREFERQVGLTPKRFARVCAFQRAIQWIGFRPEVDWADAAAVCGYHDQAHFIHEFRAFSGMTPSVYLKRRGPFLNYIAVE